MNNNVVWSIAQQTSPRAERLFIYPSDHVKILPGNLSSSSHTHRFWSVYLARFDLDKSFGYMYWHTSKRKIIFLRNLPDPVWMGDKYWSWSKKKRKVGYVFQSWLTVGCLVQVWPNLGLCIGWDIHPKASNDFRNGIRPECCAANYFSFTLYY